MEELLSPEHRDLPAEPTAAFVVFEEKLGARLLRGGSENTKIENKIKYITDLDQFVSVFDVVPDKYIDFEENSYSTVAEKHFLQFYSLIQAEVSRIKIQFARDNVDGVFDHLEIEQNLKAEIRDLIDKIKQKIESANIDLDKQDSLLKKLNKFLLELDKEKTGLAAFTSAMIQVSASTGEAAEKLEPVMVLFERAMKAIGRGAKGQSKLPKWEKPRQIEGPKEVEANSGNEDE